MKILFYFNELEFDFKNFHTEEDLLTYYDLFDTYLCITYKIFSYSMHDIVLSNSTDNIFPNLKLTYKTMYKRIYFLFFNIFVKFPCLPSHFINWVLLFMSSIKQLNYTKNIEIAKEYNKVK